MDKLTRHISYNYWVTKNNKLHLSDDVISNNSLYTFLKPVKSKYIDNESIKITIFLVDFSTILETVSTILIFKDAMLIIQSWYWILDKEGNKFWYLDTIFS